MDVYNNILHSLISIANKLDSIGMYRYASKIDELILCEAKRYWDVHLAHELFGEIIRALRNDGRLQVEQFWRTSGRPDQESIRIICIPPWAARKNELVSAYRTVYWSFNVAVDLSKDTKAKVMAASGDYKKDNLYSEIHLPSESMRSIAIDIAHEMIESARDWNYYESGGSESKEIIKKHPQPWS